MFLELQDMLGWEFCVSVEAEGFVEGLYDLVTQVTPTHVR